MSYSAGGGGFASGFGAVHGALARNMDLEQRQVATDILRRGDKEQQDFSERSRALQEQHGITPGADAQDFVDQMVQAGRAGAVAGRVPGAAGEAATPAAPAAPAAPAVGSALGGAPQPQAQAQAQPNPMEAGRGLLRDIDQRAGRQPGSSEPRRRADWDGYLRALVQEAYATGDQARVQQVLANTERTRRDTSQRLFALAHTAATNGDMNGAARALNLANEFMPDGFVNRFEATNEGVILNRQPESGEGAPQRHVIPAAQVAGYAMGMIDPQWQATYLFNQRKFDEERRHNRATEGVAAGQLELARRADGRAQESHTGARAAGIAFAELEAARRANAAAPTAETAAALEAAQQNYDRVAGGQAPERFPTFEAARNTRIDNERAAATENRATTRTENQERAVAARVAEEAARADYERTGGEQEARALTAARQARQQAESRLTVAEFSQLRQVEQRDRGLDIRDSTARTLSEAAEARTALGQARLQLRQAANEEDARQARENIRIQEARLAQGNERLEILRARLAQSAGFTPEQSRNIATDVNTIIDSTEINGVALSTAPAADAVRLWAAPIAAANRNLTVDAVTRAVIPFIADTSKFTARDLASGTITVGGQQIVLPPAFVEQLREAATAARQNAQAPRQPTGSSAGVADSARRALSGPAASLDNALESWRNPPVPASRPSATSGPRAPATAPMPPDETLPPRPGPSTRATDSARQAQDIVEGAVRGSLGRAADSLGEATRNWGGRPRPTRENDNTRGR